MRLEWIDETLGIARLKIEIGRGNAQNQAFLDALDARLDELDAWKARAVVVTGSERFFSAGLDLPSLIGLSRAAMEEFMRHWSATMLRIFEHRLPWVAALNGHAIAGGCALALQVDYRIMSEGELKIGLNEAQLGIGLPSVIIEALRCQLPPSSLQPIALEGGLFSPVEARELGLVDEVVPSDALDERALHRARELGAIPLAAWSDIKRSLRRPHSDAVRAATASMGPGWLDGWYSPDARARLQAAVDRITKKGK